MQAPSDRDGKLILARNVLNRNAEGTVRRDET
jgi:hypothetical protein